MTVLGSSLPSFGYPFVEIALQGTRSLKMNADGYLHLILRRETVPISGPSSPASLAMSAMLPILQRWAGVHLANVMPSGSYAKGTAILTGTDVDLFISLKTSATQSLRDIYENLFKFVEAEGYAPKRQNVSINIKIGQFDVDLVPARRQDTFSSDHSLYRRRVDSWTKTNVQKHIAYVKGANRLAETRVLKLWRNQKKLDFPSFYLEMAVIAALRYEPGRQLSKNVATVLEFLRDSFPTERFVDPSNTANIISDDLTDSERRAVRDAAALSLTQNWQGLVK